MSWPDRSKMVCTSGSAAASQGFVGGVGKSYKWLVCGCAGANSLSFDKTEQ
jgi:hypothetical protein